MKQKYPPTIRPDEDDKGMPKEDLELKEPAEEAPPAEETPTEQDTEMDEAEKIDDVQKFVDELDDEEFAQLQAAVKSRLKAK